MKNLCALLLLFISFKLIYSMNLKTENKQNRKAFNAAVIKIKKQLKKEWQDQQEDTNSEDESISISLQPSLRNRPGVYMVYEYDPETHIGYSYYEYQR